MVVADPDMVKQIAIKDFHKFHSRKVMKYCNQLKTSIDSIQER